MELMQAGSFPDQTFLRRRARRMFDQLVRNESAEQAFCVLSDGLLQWQGAFVSDPSVKWTFEKELRIDDLYLTGMDPDWNEIIIGCCQRSPLKLRQLIDTDPAVRQRVTSIGVDDEAIMVRADWPHRLAVLDGMHRVVSAIARRETYIQAYIGRSNGSMRQQVAPGIPYAFCRAYRLGAVDEQGLILVLRVMHRTYSNMDEILRNRLSWEPELRPIIQRVLNEPFTPSLKERLRLWMRRWIH